MRVLPILLGASILLGSYALQGCTSVGPVSCGPAGCGRVETFASRSDRPVSLTSEQMRALNTRRIQGLSLGMNRTQAMQWMGTRPFSEPDSRFHITNPVRTESYKTDDGVDVEIAYYYTDLEKSDSLVTDAELTPILFKDGVLAAWGRDVVAGLLKNLQSAASR
jgi:hypothetical protein